MYFKSHTYANLIIALLESAVGIVTVNVPAVDATVPPKLITAIALLLALELYIIAPDADIVELLKLTSAKSTKAVVPLVVIATLPKVAPPLEYPVPDASSDESVMFEKFVEAAPNVPDSPDLIRANLRVCPSRSCKP